METFRSALLHGVFPDSMLLAECLAVSLAADLLR